MTTFFTIKESDKPFIAHLSHDERLLFYYFAGCLIYASIRALKFDDLLMNPTKVFAIYQTAFQSSKSLQELETECFVAVSLPPGESHPSVSFCFTKICLTFEVKANTICLKQGNKNLTIEFNEKNNPISVSC